MCRPVDSKRCRPVLSKLADEWCSGVFVQDIKSTSKTITKEQVVEMFPNVFDEGIGHFEGEYHIRLNESVKPVRHPPRRVQVACRAKIRENKEELQKSGVIVPVSKPTPWISSMIAVPKRGGMVKCFYPKDLNKAILRQELYDAREIAIRCHGFKVFFSPRRQDQLLPCQVRRRIVILNPISHPFWSLSVV